MPQLDFGINTAVFDETDDVRNDETKCNINFFDNEDDILQIQDEIFLIIENYLSSDVLQIPDPTFFEKVLQEISYFLYDVLDSIHSDIEITSSDEEEIDMFIKETFNFYLESISLNIASEKEPASEMQFEHYVTQVASETLCDLSPNIGFLNNLQEDDFLQIQEEIYYFIEDSLSNDILQISDPKFNEKLFQEISCILYDSFDLMHLCRNITDEEEIDLFIQDNIDNYIEIIIPRRSYTPTLIIGSPNVEKIKNTLCKIRNTLQPQQRTNEWFELRHNLLTASDIGKLCGSVAKKNGLIYEKCKPLVIQEISSNVNTQSPMHWGNKYEPVSILLYEERFSTKIEEFGCIKHRFIDYLAASPDGINCDKTNLRYGRMIEVKNIVNREIDGIPSQDYWIQMQIQMEVCDLDECDFIETRIKEYENKDQFYSDNRNNKKGVVLFFISKSEIGCKPYYKYMPLHISIQCIEDWIGETINELSEHYTLYTILYWYLDQFSCSLVPRNKRWFQSICPYITDTWDMIIYDRINGFSHRMPQKINKKSICLVKLE